MGEANMTQDLVGPVLYTTMHYHMGVRLFVELVRRAINAAVQP